jgi:hypothetical protein
VCGVVCDGALQHCDSQHSKSVVSIFAGFTLSNTFDNILFFVLLICSLCPYSMYVDWETMAVGESVAVVWPCCRGSWHQREFTASYPNKYHSFFWLPPQITTGPLSHSAVGTVGGLAAVEDKKEGKYRSLIKRKAVLIGDSSRPLSVRGRAL